jgi:rhomboid protease GluP
MVTHSKRRSLLCPRCNRLISSDESTCPYCGLSNPSSWWRNNPLVKIYLNPAHIIKSINPFALFSPSNQTLLLLGATGTIPIDQFHRWWTLISASYLHGGVIHIFFNMMVLRQIAPLILQEYGFNRMIILYTLGGVIGFYISYLAGIPFTIGASASLFALIGSILFYAKSRGGTYGQMIFRQIGVWVIALFVFGFLFPGINNWAHGGGLAGGIFLAFLMGYNEKKRETQFHKTLALFCIVVTILILFWALTSTLYYQIMLS